MTQPDYDSWLEAPYQERMQSVYEFEVWMEATEDRLKEEFLIEHSELSEDEAEWDEFDRKRWQKFVNSAWENERHGF